MLTLIISAALSTNVFAAPYREGELLVRFKKGVGKDAASMVHSKAGATVKRKIQGLDIDHIRVMPGISIAEALDIYNSNPHVEHAEPNYILSAAVKPNDADFTKQWGLENTGQTIVSSSGTPDADIDAPEAWDIVNTTSAVVIAVLDSGLDYNHADLSSNIWVNGGETCGDGIDNDYNDYVDDCRGWDFVNGDNDPMDDHMYNGVGHGTHVSGIIGAKGNNSIGVAGLSWQIRLMPLKVLDAAGVGTVADEIQAIRYAVSNGANAINSSFGGYYGYSVFEKEAIEQAWQAGVVFVAACGNTSTNNDLAAFYPAGHTLPNMISVASSEFNDGLSWFTNYGVNSVHLAAPGHDIYSTKPSDSYGYQSGTSMAASFVSGTLALVMAGDPSLTALEAREIMLSSVDAKGYYTITGGRLNAHNAINTDINSIPPIRPTQLSVYGVSESTASLGWADNSSLENGFIIERMSGGMFVQIASVGANVKTYSDYGLMAGTTYHYRVYAFNNTYGSSNYSNTVSATTLTPKVESRGSGGDDGWCFIATAAFGSPLASEVQVLRRFRDGVFLRSQTGRIFVRFYYEHSPPIARYISQHGVLRLAARTALTPVVYGIKYPYAGVTLALFALGGILYMRKKRRKERLN